MDLTIGAKLLDAVLAFGWLQWTAVFFNIGYVILAARQHIACWILGGIGVTLLFFIYTDARLYSDACLQVFYLGMSVYGYLQWRQGTDDQPNEIRVGSLPMHALLLACGLVLTVLLGRFWMMFGAALPYIDAATTAFSLIATYLVARRYLENWVYWIVIDIICVWVYIDRGLVLIAVLFAIYTVLAGWGYMVWRQKRIGRREFATGS